MLPVGKKTAMNNRAAVRHGWGVVQGLKVLGTRDQAGRVRTSGEGTASSFGCVEKEDTNASASKSGPCIGADSIGRGILCRAW